MSDLALSFYRLPLEELEPLLAAVRNKDRSGIPPDVADIILTDRHHQDQAILLLRSRILYLQARQLKADAKHMNRILTGQILGNDIKLFTLLYLASEPELVSAMSGGATTDINHYIQIRRDEISQRRTTLECPDKALVSAAAGGHLSTVRFIFESLGKNLTPIGINKALSRAGENNDLEMIEYLIRQGADPLFIAIAKKKTNIQMIHRLIGYVEENQIRLDEQHPWHLTLESTLATGCQEGFELLRQYHDPTSLSCEWLTLATAEGNRLIAAAIKGNLYDIFCRLMNKEYISDDETVFRQIVKYDRPDFIIPMMDPKVTGWRLNLGHMTRYGMLKGLRYDKLEIEYIYVRNLSRVGILSMISNCVNWKLSANCEARLLLYLAYAPKVDKSMPLYYVNMEKLASETKDRELLGILRRKGVKI